MGINLFTFAMVMLVVFVLSFVSVFFSHNGGEHRYEDSLHIAGMISAGSAGAMTIMIWLSALFISL